MNLAPVRLLDRARTAGKVRPDDFVWHLTLTGPGLPPRGERLATLALTPADVARIGRENAGAGVVIGSDLDALAVGERVIARALAAERREWVARCIRAGYVDGFTVRVTAERGYLRSVFPGVGLAALASSGATPGGSSHG